MSIKCIELIKRVIDLQSTRILKNCRNELRLTALLGHSLVCALTFDGTFERGWALEMIKEIEFVNESSMEPLSFSGKVPIIVRIGVRGLPS